MTCTLSLVRATADCLFCILRSRDSFLSILEQAREVKSPPFRQAQGRLCRKKRDKGQALA